MGERDFDLGDAELEVLAVLGDDGPTAVRQVMNRLHEEAEFCCDAWVTWLLPRGRRAYAEALLQTKQFISTNHRPVPASGIGVTTTGRARRFARRITMVMTERVTPRLSVSGSALAVVLASVSSSGERTLCASTSFPRASARLWPN